MGSVSHFLEVNSFQKLIDTPFSGKVNAMGWRRELRGDFEEIVQKINQTDNITVVSADELGSLSLSPEGKMAREIILKDLQLLTDYGADPVLNLISHYEEDDFFFPTDVYSWHVDRSPIATDTFLCTYFGDSSEIVSNENTIQKILIPEIRNQLERLYEGPEEGFNDFLAENFFDLHYEPTPGVRPFQLGIGHLCRLATDNPESPVLPCVHRAPRELAGPRLLLIC
ncbi:hypothetical protein [Jiulongibacter sediminis]|jgi:hypothetical protein|uniref:hypothetical protein n=1 Tax=Jiulongibacter sediminis TaxID=1605367 RepID=UPI0026EE65A1|nr:hypothetical protein [Jiulongibacter sediminis]